MTGSYQRYIPALENAIRNAETPDAAATAADAVLASAGDLGAGDADVLGAIANLGVASAYYWYDAAARGALPGQGSASIFKCCDWGAIGWGDLVGAIGGAATALYSGAEVFPPGVIAGGVIGGAVGSAAVAFTT